MTKENTVMWYCKKRKKIKRACKECVNKANREYMRRVRTNAA